MKKHLASIFTVAVLVVSSVGNAFAGFIPPTDVPEPGTLALLGLGAAGLALFKKMK